MAKPPKSKIYTRAGDRGETTLISGKKVTKDHPRTATCGTIDELNSALGVAASFIQDKKITGIIQDTQNELFNIGAELAGEGKLKRFQLEDSKIEDLEQTIDHYDQDLTNLQTFILPAGTAAAAFLHQARTICRRAEREVVALAKKGKVSPHVIAYLNRLSDLLFVLARYSNKKAGRKEVSWKKD
jgi:cob(I)alamin adenosyltransferase